MGRVLASEDERAGDAADAAKHDKGGRAKGALPLAADVVGLVGQGGRDVGVGAGGDEKDAKVADGRALGEAHDGETNHAEDDVSDNDGAADVVLVADPAREVDDDGGKGIGRSNQALSLADRESELEVENDGQEVGEGVGDGGGVEEDHGVGPNLPVETGTEVLLDGEFLDLDITTVGVDTSANPLLLGGAKERPGLSLGVGEVDEEPVADKTEHAGEDTFNDEDPSPTVHVSKALHLHDLFVIGQLLVR